MRVVVPFLLVVTIVASGCVMWDTRFRSFTRIMTLGSDVGVVGVFSIPP
jgi:hypothetical protein